jgi:cysteinyl-tRNA synthetase
VRVDDEKMSKSLGNFFTIRDVINVSKFKYQKSEEDVAEVIRFFILRAHYRSPLNYSDAHLDDAKASLTRLYTALRSREVSTNLIDWTHPQAARFKAAMDDDFNTPEAVAVLFDLANEVNKTNSIEAAILLKSLAAVVGLLQRDANKFLQGVDNRSGSAQSRSGVSSSAFGVASYTEDSIKLLIEKRAEAKKLRNFAEADDIRKDLADKGVVLEDTPQGTTWRRA